MVSSVDNNGPRLFKKARRSLLKSDRTYIVPTKFGGAFGLTLLVLFFFAVGYANNLIYLFVFLLIALALVGMWGTNKNIDDLQFAQALEPTLFADEMGELQILVMSKNPDGSSEVKARTKGSHELTSANRVPNKETIKIKIPFKPEKRGLHQAPKVTIESDFPFGLLRSWKSWTPWQDIYIYPKLEGELNFPIEASGSGNLGDLGVFREHRNYTSSDPLNRIDWKASARRAELLTKHYEEQAQNTLSFDWAQTAHLKSFEKRISQLAVWIQEAQKKGQTFTLKLGLKTYETPEVNANWRQAMQGLATLQEKDIAW